MSEYHTAAFAAADPGRSAWVSANAGAGKTHALANRVTRLLLDGARPERILCLTYTKSAAAEMQARLSGQLGAWSMLEDDKLRTAIAAIGAPAPDADWLRRARRLFALALETPGGLKIQTIHSFCQYLLSRFPIEAGIPPGFRVLDNQASRDLIAEARAEILERAGSGDRQLADAVAFIVTETSEARLQQILDAALGGDRRELERFFSELPEKQGAALQRIASAHGAGPDETVEQIADQFCAEARAQRERLEETIKWLSHGGKKDKECAEHLRAFVTRDCSPDAFRALRNAFCTKDGEPRESMATKPLRSAAPGLFEYISRMAERYIAAEQRCRAARAAQLAHAALVLADAVNRRYADMKRARAALDYNDLITRTLHLLKTSNAAAWVLYKLDGGLDHILIDEAQDTSPEQWQIVQKLTEEFFAGKSARDLFDGRRTIFAVGDEKQSIFSFQGADPAAFAANRHHFAQRAGAEFVDVALTASRRSAPEILAFVDAVFADPEAREGLTSDGGPIRHEIFRTSAEGRVEFWPAIKQPKAPEPDPWRPVDVESEASPVVQLAENIAAQIRAWLDKGVCLPGHEDAIRPGDIMILVPRREPFASEVIRRLIERGVPVAGADRIRLKNEIVVMDLMALGRFTLLPEDDLNLAALLRSPMINISEEELFSLSAHRKSSLWREVSERQEAPSFGFAHEFLTEMLARADFLPPYEFFAYALAAKGMRARFLSRLGEEGSDAIDEFLSLALEYEKNAAPSLQGFLHWIQRGDAEIKRDMERARDEVRVMTVHGAKGLEADIVILPDTTSLPDPPGRRGELLYGGNGIVFPIRNPDASAAVLAAKEAAKAQAMKEHRRLLYVALTRARERLYICGFENKNGVRDGSWYRLAERAAQSIGRKVPRGDGFIYVIGEEHADSIASTGRARSSSVELPDWVRSMPPPECERPRLVRPSDEAIADEPAGFSPAGPSSAARFRRGILVHTLLARLPELAADQRAAISLAFLSSQGLATDEARHLIDETLRVLEDPEFAATFAPGSRAEVGIVSELPELGEGARVSGRIDRLAVTDSEVLAIDFKTNRSSPKSVEDTPSLYLRQMALYRLALAKLFPHKRIACALVWTDGPRLMRLPDALLDREIAGLRARLDAA